MLKLIEYATLSWRKLEILSWCSNLNFIVLSGACFHCGIKGYRLVLLSFKFKLGVDYIKVSQMRWRKKNKNLNRQGTLMPKCFLSSSEFISSRNTVLNACWHASKWLLNRENRHAGECNINAKPIWNANRWVNHKKGCLSLVSIKR